MLVYQRVINIRIKQILTAQICLNSIYICKSHETHWTYDFLTHLHLWKSSNMYLVRRKVGKESHRTLGSEMLGTSPMEMGETSPTEWRFSEENMGSWWSTVKKMLFFPPKIETNPWYNVFCKFWCQHVIVVWVITIKRGFVWQGDYQWYQWYPKVFAGLATWHLVWLSRSAKLPESNMSPDRKMDLQAWPAVAAFSEAQEWSSPSMREPQLKLDWLQSGKGSGYFAVAKHILLLNRNMIINSTGCNTHIPII